MGKLHRLVGVAGVLIFLGTGVYLVTEFPQLHGGNAAVRYQFRANHAYILLSSLLNGAIGIYLVPKEAGWRRAAQRFGSLLLLAAPAVLLAAFFLEPARGIPQRPLTTLGMVLSLGGIVLHALGRGRAP
jgi:heme A synthase